MVSCIQHSPSAAGLSAVQSDDSMRVVDVCSGIANIAAASCLQAMGNMLFACHACKRKLQLHGKKAVFA